MTTTYLGLELRSPVIVASSPFTADSRSVARCAEEGAGAVVLKSIFEEQIVHQTASLERGYVSPFGDTAEYLSRYLGDDYKARFLDLVADSAATGIPVIGSINCIGADERWVEYATAMADAGAAALELNIYFRPADRHTPAAELERLYTGVAAKVTSAVCVPVAVKMPMYITNMLHLGDALLGRGVRGLTLFNRYFEPDVDIERIAYTAGSPYSLPGELRGVLRPTALASSLLPQLDIAVSTGVHDGEAAVKALLCGARAVQICTAIHNGGFGAIGRIGGFVDAWAARQGFRSLEAFRGRLDFGSSEPEIFHRVQYMRYFPVENN